MSDLEAKMDELRRDLSSTGDGAIFPPCSSFCATNFPSELPETNYSG
jgi:hypothetical protein